MLTDALRFHHTMPRYQLPVWHSLSLCSNKTSSYIKIPVKKSPQKNVCDFIVKDIDSDSKLNFYKSIFLSISLLPKNFTPDSGSIRFTNPEKPDTAPRISVVFQEPRLFPWMTVRENVSLAVRELPGSEKWGRTDEALKAVRLCDAADAFPKELSGGMAQRAGFARAIAQSPDILLLDEAFGALDALTRTVLYQEFQALQSERRMTVLLITHDVLEAARPET